VVTTFLSVPIRGTAESPTPPAATRQAPFSRAPGRAADTVPLMHDELVTIFDGGPSLRLHRRDDRPNRVSRLHPFRLLGYRRATAAGGRVISGTSRPAVSDRRQLASPGD
jgi:hypothetical protein